MSGTMVLRPGFSLQPCDEFRNFPKQHPQTNQIGTSGYGMQTVFFFPSFLGDFSVQPGLKVTGLNNWFQKFIVPQNPLDEFSRSGVEPSNLLL